MDYPVPAEEIRREMIVVNSRFIATLAPTFSIDEAKTFIARVRKEFADATHNVPAYLIGGGNSVIAHASDDGEPSGTAGRPALAVLRGSGLGDVTVVITRYFGGTKLGTGGLVKAYTQATQQVISAVPRAVKMMTHTVMLALPYPLLERTRLLVKRHQGTILDETFGADVTMTLRFPIKQFNSFKDGLQELSAGKITPEIIETKTVLVAQPNQHR